MNLLFLFLSKARETLIFRVISGNSNLFLRKDSVMRKRFEQQISLGKILIEDVEIPLAKRSGPLPSLCAALEEIFTTPKWNKKVFEILEQKVFPKNNNTGRPGMDLWAIFVLAQVRNCENISYDRHHYLANHDKLVRKIMDLGSKM